jgi:pyruvate dehydrogenase E2 component (dihydrolipoamide acetyltransferase)
MAENMARSAREVPGSTVTDEVIVNDWRRSEDVTVRLVQAIVAACKTEGALNAWYDPSRKARKLHDRIDLGIALDTVDGLFVPVLRDAARHDTAAIRSAIETLKAAVTARKASAAELAGQTFTLSNFGMMGGLTAALAIVPPQVAILGAGRIFEAIRPIAGKPAIARVLPLSLTFDHRVVTGREAVRFLNALISDLSRAFHNGD